MHTHSQRGHQKCDLRSFTRTLLIAAATVLSLSATVTSARAAILELVIDHDLSSIKLDVIVDASAFVPTWDMLMTTPQQPGSDTANYTGTIFIDLQPGTIQLMPGSSIIADVTGNYMPGDDGSGTPTGTPTPGNYGLVLPNLAVQANIRELVSDFGVPASGSFGGVAAAPSTPVALAGGTFDLAGQGMAFVAGRRVITSLAGNTAESFVGYPTYFGSNGDSIGTWDGTTLTIPVFSEFSEHIADDPADVFQTTVLSGYIVAHVIPEPSSLVLLGMGVSSLAIASYRARRKKA